MWWQYIGSFRMHQNVLIEENLAVLGKWQHVKFAITRKNVDISSTKVLVVCTCAESRVLIRTIEIGLLNISNTNYRYTHKEAKQFLVCVWRMCSRAVIMWCDLCCVIMPVYCCFCSIA